MNRLVLSVTLLLVGITFAGCYTQIGYYEPRSPTRQTFSHHQDERQHRDEGETMESEQDVQAEVEAESAPPEAEDEGYYGRRRSTHSDSDLYYRPYDYDYYPTSPYYGGYHPLYPYYGYSYYPYHSRHGYYSGYGYHGYRHHGYRHHRYRYSKRLSKIGDVHFGRQRSQSYRGVRSGHPSSRRPSRSLMKREESKAPARSASGSRFERSRRSGRR